MNWALMALWNQHVSPDETVVFVGDFAWHRDDDLRRTIQRKIEDLWEILNRIRIFVQGDHDHVIPSNS
jgi:calcineurin-like phosphoesterase family protein